MADSAVRRRAATSPESAPSSSRSRRLFAARPRAVWLSPVFLALVIGAGALIPAAIIDDETFRTLWRTPKSIDVHTIAMFASGVLAFAFGALISIALYREPRDRGIAWPALPGKTLTILHKSSITLTTLTVLGYVGFAVVIARSGIGPTELFSGSPEVKDSIGTIPGVTTLTQFGMAAVVVSSILIVKKYSHAELCRLLAVVAFGVLRAFINSERLAILELVVPIVVVFAASLASKPGKSRRYAQIIPFVFPALVVAIFAASEYFRSWTFYRLQGTYSFGEFVLYRIAGYYATAANNGYLNFTHLRWHDRVPFDTISGLWQAPGVEKLGLYEMLGGRIPPIAQGDDASPYTTVLSLFGNPEFNSESGYASAFVDYGLVGGLIFFFIVGLLIGSFYKSFCSGSIYGLLNYPVAFIGVLELPRYVYWTYGRVIYTWLAIAIIIYLVSASRRRGRTRCGRLEWETST